MSLIISYVALGLGAAAAIATGAMALRLFRANKLESKKSALRASSLSDALWGRTHIQDDHIPDARVRGGMIFNKKKQRLEISGRLSRDTLDRIFR